MLIERLELIPLGKLLNSVLDHAVQCGSFSVLSVKFTERLYANGIVYNSSIQICKNLEICILFCINDTSLSGPFSKSFKTQRAGSTVTGMIY